MSLLIAVIIVFGMKTSELTFEAGECFNLIHYNDNSKQM